MAIFLDSPLVVLVPVTYSHGYLKELTILLLVIVVVSDIPELNSSKFDSISSCDIPVR